MMLCSGAGKSTRIEAEMHTEHGWGTVAVYEPKYCPNCGRSIMEYAKKKNTDEEEKFYFPDGCYLKMRVSTGKVNASEKDERNWRSLDVILLWPSGTEDVLCCFDYEDQKGLRILVYDREREEPIFEHLVRR